MLDIPSISAIVAAVGVLVGVVIAVLELRNLTRTRQTELFVSLYSNIIRKEFMEAVLKVGNLQYKDYNDFEKKYGLPFSENPVHTALNMVAMYCEAIGVLLKRKMVDIGLVADLLGVEMLWQAMKPVVEGMRKRLNEPRTYEWFEYLYNEVHAREQRLRPELYTDCGKSLE